MGLLRSLYLFKDFGWLEALLSSVWGFQGHPGIDINHQTMGEREWELGYCEHHFHPYYIHRNSIVWLPPHTRAGKYRSWLGSDFPEKPLQEARRSWIFGGQVDMSATLTFYSVQVKHFRWLIRKLSQKRRIRVIKNCEINVPQWLLMGPYCLQSTCEWILWVSEEVRALLPELC